MFKINKLDIVDNEKVTINLVTQENYMIDTKVKDRFKTLSFDINCKLEELLTLEHSKTIDFNRYIFESYLIVNEIPDISPVLYSTINRYMNNRYVIAIHFFSNILTDIEKTELL